LILIQHVHGEALRVSPTATAFALREESYVISVLAAWDGGEAQQHVAWARACCKALSPFASSGVYVNLPLQRGGRAGAGSLWGQLRTVGRAQKHV